MRMFQLVLGALAVAGAGFALSLAGCGGPAQSTEANRAESPAAAAAVEPAAAADTAMVSGGAAGSGGAKAAIEKAADAGKYAFVFFWKAEDESTAAMRKIFDETMAKLPERADAVVAKVTDPAHKELVDEYGLDRAPMPLVLAIAPNGAVTGGFPNPFSEQDLLGGFASPGTQKCIKSLQDGKLVFLCIQNGETESNQEALQGVRDFQADERFSSATEIVMLDPADAGEAEFLSDLQVEPDTETAVTAFLLPPGSPIGMFEGATTKDQLVATLMQASSGCGPGGCGPGGCGPR